MSTATAHVKRPFKGGGAFKDRDLANRALESEKRLRELMGMLLEARTTLARLLEADDDDEWEDVDDDDEEEWEDIESGEDCEGVDDDDDWEDIEDGEDCEDVDDEDEWEDIDDDDQEEDIKDDEDCEDTEAAESALLSSLRALMQTAAHSSPSDPPTQTHTLPETLQHDSEDGYSSDDDPSDFVSDLPNDNSSVASYPDDNSSSNSSLFLSSFLSKNPPIKDYPPIGHLSFATIEEARTAYYSMLQKVENLLVKWYHKDDVTALVKTLIESTQASYAEQEEFWKDRHIVQEWFGGIDK